MTLNDDEAALAFGEAGIAEDAFDAATYVRDLREAGYVVARLSHDQGADDPVYDELYRIVHQAPFHPEAGGISVHFSIEDIKRQKAVLAERALSVPAPTLPALVSAARLVLSDLLVLLDNPPHHPIIGVNEHVEALREALRDAV